MRRVIILAVFGLLLHSNFTTSAPALEDRKLTAAKIVHQFATNEAFADQNFVGKKLEVTGKVTRVSRNNRSAKPSEKYVLEMDQEKLGSTDKVNVDLVFIFSEDDRATLAQLKPGQEIAIGGECADPAHWAADTPAGRKAYIRVTIVNCEIIKGK